MGPVQHDVIVYSDSVSCLQAIEGKNVKNLSFAISWTSSGYWVTKVYMSAFQLNQFSPDAILHLNYSPQLDNRIEVIV